MAVEVENLHQIRLEEWAGIIAKCVPTGHLAQPRRPSPTMKILFDLFPIILFFAAYQFGEANPETAQSMLSALGLHLHAGSKPGVFLATVVAIAATFGQIAWVWLKHRKVDTMLWVSLALIVVFGGATLFLQDETFIKWKPTVLYWLFALALGLAPVLFERNLIRLMMEKSVTLPEPVWMRLNLAWAGFFTFMGVANLVVAFNYSTDAWVNFKMFGSLGLMILFVIAQSVYLGKHIKETP
jgi:intracellular septation protein